MKKYIYFLILFGIGIYNVQAAEQSLLWTGQSIDDHFLLNFIDSTKTDSKLKSENEIIKILRTDYGLKVIILDKKAPDLEINPKLTIGNDDKDTFAVETYERDLRKQTAFHEDVEVQAQAQFLQPYFHVHSEYSKHAIPRDFIEQPLILLTKSATSHGIIHEYIHAYLEKKRERAPIDLGEGNVHHENCFRQIKLNELKEKVLSSQKNLERLSRSPYTSDTQGKQASRNFWRATAEFSHAYLDFHMIAYGEEMDVYRFLFEKRKELNFSPDVTQFHLDGFDLYLTLVENMLEEKFSDIDETLEKISSVSFFNTEPDIQASFEELKKKVENIKEKLNNSKEWLGSQK